MGSEAMRKILVGVVATDPRPNSLRVEIDRRMKHPKYGKIVRGRTVCHVHDAESKAKKGDTVEIIECPPRSKLKRWELVRVISSSAVAAVSE